MPHPIHRLTDPEVRNAQAKAAPLKLSDGGGLYLLVQSSGARYWRLGYRFAGRQRLLALGVFPAVTLRAARLAAAQAREKLRSGIDPAQLRQLHKRQQQACATNSFRGVALEWFAQQKPSWAENHLT